MVKTFAWATERQIQFMCLNNHIHKRLDKTNSHIKDNNKLHMKPIINASKKLGNIKNEKNIHYDNQFSFLSVIKVKYNFLNPFIDLPMTIDDNRYNR